MKIVIEIKTEDIGKTLLIEGDGIQVSVGSTKKPEIAAKLLTNPPSKLSLEKKDAPVGHPNPYKGVPKSQWHKIKKKPARKSEAKGGWPKGKPRPKKEESPLSDQELTNILENNA